MKTHIAHVLDALCHLLHMDASQRLQTATIQTVAFCLDLHHALQLCSYSGESHRALKCHDALHRHNSMCSAGRLNAACHGCWGHGLQL